MKTVFRIDVPGIGILDPGFRNCRSRLVLIACSKDTRRDMTKDTEKSPDRPAQPPRAGEAASKAEHAARHAPESAVAPHEKQAIGAETSREEDA